MNRPTYERFGEYILVSHTTGRLRFAVWFVETDEEICWCIDREQAVTIIDALRTVGRTA